MVSSLCGSGCSDSGVSVYGTARTIESSTCWMHGVSDDALCQGHFVGGVSRLSAGVGLMCGRTSVFVKNATSGAQYVSGFVLHSSLDKSICRRGMRGLLLRSPHNRVVQVWCGETNELFKQSVIDVPVFVRKRGKVTGTWNFP